MYTTAAIEAALPAIGGMAGWEQRLAKRAVYQASVERAFGPHWRELRWIGSSQCAEKRRRLACDGYIQVC
jgi:hypothetical protein